MGLSHYSGEIGFQIFELYFHCTMLTAILLNSSNFFIIQAGEENIVVADGFKVFLPDTPTEVEAANARRESTDGSNTINGHISVLLPASSELKAESLELGCSALKLGRDAHGGSYEEHSDINEKVNINSDSYISDRPSGGLTTSGQSRDANDDTLVLHSAKVENYDSFLYL